MTEPESAEKPNSKFRTIGRIAFALITVLCFAYLYYRINGAAAREGMTVFTYMANVFEAVDWLSWILLMVAYSLFYFLIDTLVVARVLSWFVADVKYKDLLPVRGSAYIVSIFNEQIGKGAMVYYLNKRYKVPGWEVGSVMLFIMFCEVFYLMVWAALGFAFSPEGNLPEAFNLVPYIAMGGGLFLVLWISLFRFEWFPSISELRIFHAFRHAKPKHYLYFLLLRSPALIAAIFVYTAALNMFGVEASLLSIWPFLPIVFFAAAIPTPMRAAAITFWVILFPENEGQMAAFGLVQHNFFILFNAVIGLLFWRRAQRDLFGEEAK